MSKFKTKLQILDKNLSNCQTFYTFFSMSIQLNNYIINIFLNTYICVYKYNKFFQLCFCFKNLKEALDALFDANVPNSWSKISWHSSSIGFWFTELVERNSQLNSWIFESRPKCFWMTGFFNPQGKIFLLLSYIFYIIQL